MMSNMEMTEHSAQSWMPLSNAPELHSWLAPEQSEEDRNRLGVIGNIVVPQMAFFAAQMLKQAWMA